MKNKKLLFYGVDLTHNDIALASGTFPLGLAYTASAVKKKFGNDIDIKLFKYPQDLSTHLKKETPDFYFFSNYVWNQNLNLSFAKKVKSRSTNTLVVSGGPNLSKDTTKRRDFLLNNAFIDFWILQEGELPSCYLIKSYLELNGNISQLKESAMPSTLCIKKNRELGIGKLLPRLGMITDTNNLVHPDHPVPRDFFDDMLELKDIPSPYLNGLMDKFFDNQLYPLIETNRGCPFSCSFCQQGTEYFTKVAKRPLHMCVEEFEYIAKNMVKKSPGVTRVEIADPNFAMFPQDLKFCEEVREIQEKYQWPQFIGCSTGKNQPERILNAVSKLMPDSLVISNSMQSSNNDTLEAIKRKNIKLEGYKKVQLEIQKRGLRSMADVILGLPLETKKSHQDAVFNLIDSGVQEFTSYQAMILKSTELELAEAKMKYNMVTKWRLLPRAIGNYEICDEHIILPEVEEIVIATDTLTFQDYLESRCLHLTTMIYHNSGVFDVIHKYLKGEGIQISQFISAIFKNITSGESSLRKVSDEFIDKTESELFDSEMECINFYNKPENFSKVKKSEIGGNLLWKHLGLTFFSHWDNAVEACLTTIKNFISFSEGEEKELEAYLKARIVDLSKDKIIENIPIQINSERLRKYILNEEEVQDKKPINMSLKKEKVHTLNHAKTCYPNDSTGWSLILAVHRVHTVTREPTLENVSV